jgi:hypothetical protein
LTPTPAQDRLLADLALGRPTNNYSHKTVKAALRRGWVIEREDGSLRVSARAPDPSPEALEHARMLSREAMHRDALTAERLVCKLGLAHRIGVLEAVARELPPRAQMELGRAIMQSALNRGAGFREGGACA